jgi:hypothetical protein
MMIKLLLKGLKVGFFVNVFLTFSLIFYTVLIENWLSKPLSGIPQTPVKLGTVVDYHRLFDADPPSMKLRPSWLKIQNKFSYFIIEYQLRFDYNLPSPRLLNWCRVSNCFAHRIAYDDSRKNLFKAFTLDDWFTNFYLSTRNTKVDSQALASFLRSLSPGSTVIISEPIVTLSSPPVFRQFSEWVLFLRSQHPHLKFEIGLQIHLQWIDAYWFKSRGVIPAIARFSKTSGVPWGLSEFSVYDQIWKRRLRDNSFRDRPFYRIEQLVPRRLRRAIVLHSSYVIHRTAAENGAIRFTEWGNSQSTAWFVNEIDSAYDSNYELFTPSGTPTPLWWAGLRGFRDAKLQ